MKTPITAPIASLDLIHLDQKEGKREVSALIGLPYRVDQNAWACPIELRGLETQYNDIHGEGSLQALCLSLAFLRKRLCDLLDQGHIFYIAGDDEALDRAYVETLIGFTSTTN